MSSGVPIDAGADVDGVGRGACSGALALITTAASPVAASAAVGSAQRGGRRGG